MEKNQRVINFLHNIEFFDKMSLLKDILYDLTDDLEDNIGEVILNNISPNRMILQSKRKIRKISVMDIYGDTPQTFTGVNLTDNKIDRFLDDCNYGLDLFLLLRYELELKFAEGVKYDLSDKIETMIKIGIIDNFCQKLEYVGYKIKTTSYSGFDENIKKEDSESPEKIFSSIIKTKNKLRKIITFNIYCPFNLDMIKESIIYNLINDDRKEDFIYLVDKYKITIEDQKEILKIIENLK